MTILESSVPLEDWYEELADEDADPLNILVSEEEDDDEPVDVKQSIKQQFEDKTMTHTTSNKPAFDVNAWLATAKVLANHEAKVNAVPCPEWLTLSKGTVCRDNAFAVTAGVVKAARQILDAIAFTQRQYDDSVEKLHMQEQRNTRQTAGGPGAFVFGPKISALGVTLASQQTACEAPGFNPDGMEFHDALDELNQEVDKLEQVLENGKRILAEVLQWINDHAADLNLEVEVGFTVERGIIGNEIRKRKYSLLTPETLLLGIERQREFLRNMIR